MCIHLSLKARPGAVTDNCAPSRPLSELATVVRLQDFAPISTPIALRGTENLSLSNLGVLLNVLPLWRQFVIHPPGMLEAAQQFAIALLVDVVAFLDSGHVCPPLAQNAERLAIERGVTATF
jgi:hypothetical protein